MLNTLLIAHTFAATWRYRNQSWASKRKKEKFFCAVIGILTALQQITYLSFLNLKHIIQFINMILSVYLKRSLALQSRKGTKTSNWMATICSGQIIQVIQNKVVFVSFTKKLGVRIVKSLSQQQGLCWCCIQVTKPSFEFENFLSNFEKVLSETTLCNSLFTIIFGDFYARSPVW